MALEGILLLCGIVLTFQAYTRGTIEGGSEPVERDGAIDRTRSVTMRCTESRIAGVVLSRSSLSHGAATVLQGSATAARVGQVCLQRPVGGGRMGGAVPMFPEARERRGGV